MLRFIYTAKSSPQKTFQGRIEAESEQDALAKLNRLGYFPVSITAEDLSLPKHSSLRFLKIPRRELLLFTRQLSNLLESGVNILNGLTLLENQARNKYFKAILHDVADKIKDGKSLSESLSTHPALFSGLYTAMIHSGEAGGSLEQTLKRLSAFLEREEELKNSIKAALTYPLFLLAVSVVTIIILLGFVVPKLVVMFEDMGQALPLPTQILIATSGFLRAYWWAIALLIFISALILRRLNQTAPGKLLFHRLLLKAPLAGDITLKTEISRFTRTLSLLLSSGMPIVYSLEVSMSVLGNEAVKREVQGYKDKISKGISLYDCLKGSTMFPPLVINIVGTGEETGTLEKSLLNISDDYEKEIDRSLKTLTRLLEPVIILIMGLIVGFIVISMLLPIFQINLIVR